MAAPLKSKEEFHELYKSTVQAADPDHDQLSDWSDGSINDMLAGACAVIATELQFRIVEQFSKTLFANAEDEELDELVVDRFGEEFERPGDVKAVGVAKFTRSSSSGTYTLPAGTTIETTTPVGGSAVQFVTDIDLEFADGQSVGYVTITAVEAGSEGNVDAAEITTINPPIAGLSVTNETETAGGDEELSRSEYLAHVGDLISTLRGGTDTGIEAKLRAVPGIEKATVQTQFKAVKNWNIAGASVEGDPYTIVLAKAYIADANGTGNDALVALAEAALITEKAAGVNIQVIAASAQEMDWTADFTLNVSGPNFATLSVNPEAIRQTMRDYIDNLGIGDDFIRATANAHVLSVWGPSGSDDITGFTTTTPSGDVSTGENVKLIPGTMELE
jgi:uncharacterized phage protein gp47/JayE